MVSIRGDTNSRPNAAIRALRAVALFETAKGLLVLLGGVGLFELVHHDTQQFAEQLVAHTHLNPANGYPKIFLDLAAKLTDAKLFALALLALTYASIRLGEAYGLWFDRNWAQWLGAVSGGIYLPVEIYELFHHVSGLKLIVFFANLGIVVLLVWRLVKRNVCAVS
jgi:uncharacterized membrane protein (DUF2068 family)